MVQEMSQSQNLSEQSWYLLRYLATLIKVFLSKLETSGIKFHKNFFLLPIGIKHEFNKKIVINQ